MNDNEIISTINGLSAQFKCQYCNNIQKMNVFPYINFSKNPEYYAKVKNLDIFKNKCNKCGKENIIQYDMLIIDEVHKYFLYLLTDSSNIETFKNKISYFIHTNENLPELNDCKTRLVIDINQLIEKMAIFEIGLNDKVIELIKKALIETNQVDNKNIYFDAVNETDLNFIVIDNDNKIDKLQVNFNLYNNTLDNISHLPEFNEEDTFQIIDYNWVSEKLSI